MANILDMVADTELTTLDDEMNSIVSELRSAFTHELSTLYSYMEKVQKNIYIIIIFLQNINILYQQRNAVNIAYYSRKEQDVPVALQKALQVFTQCRYDLESCLDQHDEGKVKNIYFVLFVYIFY